MQIPDAVLEKVRVLPMPACCGSLAVTVPEATLKIGPPTRGTLRHTRFALNRPSEGTITHTISPQEALERSTSAVWRRRSKTFSDFEFSRNGNQAETERSKS